MKFTVAKQDLESALGVVTSAMSSTGNDLTSHYLFRRPLSGAADRMEVLTHSGRIVSLCPFIALVEGDPAGISMFTVEGWRLRQWVAEKPDAALVFDFNEETKMSVIGVQGMKTGIFMCESLDPANWHFWDKALFDAQMTAKLPAHRLHHALNHAQRFASDQEAKMPEYCVCEVKNEVLASTDKIAATVLRIQGLEKSNMKVHVRDAGGILAFLSLMKEEEVEIREHPRTTFFVRENGAVYGESRFTASFPDFKRPSDSDAHVWTLDVETLKKNLRALTASAAKEDSRVRFLRPDKTGPVIMRVSVKDKEFSIHDELEVLSESSVPSAPEIPEEGFELSHPRLLDLLELQKETQAKFGITVRIKDGEVIGGYVRFHNTVFADKDGNGGDEYTTVLAFLRANG